MGMVEEYGHAGYAEYLGENGLEEAFINTLKMEPHYAGWMHDRAHGWLSIEDVAIAHDVNHLTVLSHDQIMSKSSAVPMSRPPAGPIPLPRLSSGAVVEERPSPHGDGR